MGEFGVGPICRALSEAGARWLRASATPPARTPRRGRGRSAMSSSTPSSKDLRGRFSPSTASARSTSSCGVRGTRCRAARSNGWCASSACSARCAATSSAPRSRQPNADLRTWFSASSKRPHPTGCGSPRSRRGGGPPGALRDADRTPRPHLVPIGDQGPPPAASPVTSPQVSGGRGIRTHGTSHPAQRFSRPPPSASRRALPVAVTVPRVSRSKGTATGTRSGQLLHDGGTGPPTGSCGPQRSGPTP